MWYVLTLIVAVMLNFLLPRLMPGNPVSAIAVRASNGMTDQTAVQKVYEEYVKTFGIDKPLYVQFFHYVNLWNIHFGMESF